jgi:hypothetical protein
MTKLTERQAKDLKYLKDPELWPQWPIMPMKKHTEGKPMPTCGTVFAAEELLTTVIIDEGVLLWGNEKEHERVSGKTYGEIAAMFPNEKFDSPEVMLLSGWECD